MFRATSNVLSTYRLVIVITTAGRCRWALVPLLVVALLAPPASAAPLQVARDRSDNTFYLTYEGASGRITAASSSGRFVRGDAVSFLIYVSEAPEGAERGERLVARFSFELNRKRAVRYAGTFRFELRNDAGVAVHSGSVQRKLVLRPRSGQRKKGFSLPFDVPTGAYEAKAFFKAS